MTDPAHDAEQDAGEKKARKVPKTMLFNNPLAQADKKRKVAKTRVFSKELENRTAEASTASGAATDAHDAAGKPRKVAKTRLEFSLDNLKDEIEKAAQTQEREMLEQAKLEQAKPEQAEPAEKPKRYVARTRLDHSILYDTVVKAAEKQEAAVEELIKTRANEPVKPFISVESKKAKLACPWTWSETDSPERVRYCDRCKNPVYNFAGIEMPEAESIVYTRENIEHPHLLKRDDGKYMTRECPQAVKRRKDTIVLSLVGVVVAAGIITVLMMLPPPPKPVAETHPTHQAEPETPVNVMAEPGKTTESKDGSFHWTADQGVVEAPKAQDEPAKPAKQAPTAAEEAGQMWQYEDQTSASDPMNTRQGNNAAFPKTGQ